MTTVATWQPIQGARWDIYLQGSYTSDNTAIDVLDIDLFSNNVSQVQQLQQSGSRAICYFSAGTYENWRDDWKASADQLGNALPDWPGEWWCDIRLQSVRDVMTSRIELAAGTGCDAVDPDNVDGYSNNNGLNLTEEDAVDYVSFLATTAHAHGLSIGLKNAIEVMPNLSSMVDFAVSEQCHADEACSLYTNFTTNGKNVFQIEYPKGSKTNNDKNASSSQVAAICNDPAVQSGFSTVMKNMNLDTWHEFCPNMTSASFSSNQTAPPSSGSNNLVESRLYRRYSMLVILGMAFVLP